MKSKTNLKTKELKSDIAVKFLSENLKGFKENKRIKKYSLGLFANDILIGIAQICSSQADKIKEKYSLELFRIFIKEGFSKDENIQKLLKDYCQKHNPNDLFVPKGILNNREILSEINFKETSEGWEWYNPKTFFYTYKITASDSEKYYLGVKIIHKINAEEIDCLNDGYFGSGGSGDTNKFNNWKRKHSKNLKKEIMGIYHSKMEAYQAEADLIGDLWQSDFNCLNSIPGGFHPRSFFVEAVFIKECKVHGLTKHQGKSCCRCSAARVQKEKFCKIHGMTAFNGDNSCWKCRNSEMFTIKTCPIHGETKHQGDVCSSCHMGKNYTQKFCKKCKEITNFKGNTCHKCSLGKLMIEKECKIHGLSKHKKDQCMKCLSARTQVMKYCSVCDEDTKHNGTYCYKCKTSSKSV